MRSRVISATNTAHAIKYHNIAQVNAQDKQRVCFPETLKENITKVS